MSDKVIEYGPVSGIVCCNAEWHRRIQHIVGNKREIFHINIYRLFIMYLQFIYTADKVHQTK